MQDDEKRTRVRHGSAFSVILVLVLLAALIVILLMPNPVPLERIIFYQLFGGLVLAIAGGTVAGWGIAAFVGSPSTTTPSDKGAPRSGPEGTKPKSTAPGGAPTGEQPGAGSPEVLRAVAALQSQLAQVQATLRSQTEVVQASNTERRHELNAALDALAARTVAAARFEPDPGYGYVRVTLPEVSRDLLAVVDSSEKQAQLREILGDRGLEDLLRLLRPRTAYEDIGTRRGTPDWDPSATR